MHATACFCLVLGVIACKNNYERSKRNSFMPMSFSTQDSGYINMQLMSLVVVQFLMEKIGSQ